MAPEAGKPLEASELSRGVLDAALEFETTGDLEPLEDWPGQERALDALRMAAESRFSDFNLFVLGNPGTGRRSAVRALLSGAAESLPRPSDWVYVNDFDDPRRPRAMDLPPGRAMVLKAAVEKLIDDLANEIPAVFESEDYQARRRAIEESYSDRQEQAMGELAEKARARGVAIMRTPMGFGVAARQGEEILTPEAYHDLPEDTRERIDAAMAEISAELEEILGQVPKGMKAQRREVEALNVEMTEHVVDDALSEVKAEFAGEDNALRFLEAMRDDIIENADLFLIREDGATAGAFPVATTKHYAKPQFRRYAVNVMVSQPHTNGHGAPVVEESLPTLANLIGRIEYAAEQGALVTNFTMIRAGALHRANGGFLVLDARQVLIEPFAWDALKRALRSGEISIFSAGERLSLISTETLEPDPIPLKLRVVLVGERMLYYMLTAFDPEFAELFKIEADFDDRMPRDVDSAKLFARLAGTIARREDLRPLDAPGVRRLLLESTRLSDDAERFSLNLGRLSDILREADHWAGGAGSETIGAPHIDSAIEAAERRAGRLRELSQEMIHRGTLMIDTDGAHVGQINALSVLEIGKSRFGRPSRVSARVRVGSGKVVDIERETELGGPLHSKGVMILSGYLAGQYAPEEPMSLWASLVFEQSYGGIDGDSASAAELFALLSALSELPIDQSFAVTGSVNQFGDIQAIGGVNEKIEGFFDVCAARGLTGRQAVLIPETNIKHLVLRRRVVEAVESGQFRIIPIATIDQGIAHLTGRDAGARGADGRFPEGSVNALVEARLQAFAETRRSFGLRNGQEKGKP
ncbi:ATP-binding protein [Actibacterium sp. MT2.3-13A]|uniref:Lon protease family protein n=1 Tax=Actibacterium sp. MT2.3-13A TaxID=2828332 RepID=UPI001BA681E0|nr:ATP-binding protein [Actibacterium sp. MT2.3-13A]